MVVAVWSLVPQTLNKIVATIIIIHKYYLL